MNVESMHNAKRAGLLSERHLTRATVTYRAYDSDELTTFTGVVERVMTQQTDESEWSTLISMPSICGIATSARIYIEQLVEISDPID